MTPVGPAGVLVIGAGQAGLAVAASLRDLGFDGPIRLVGSEPHPPYQRPPLSKAYLKGSTQDRALSLRAPEFYLDQGIDLLLGSEVVELSPEAGGAGAAVCADGRHLRYDRLVLATGAGARPLSLEGSDARGVHRLRDLSDAEALRQDLAEARSVVVLGGGFLGLEVAAAARELGKHTVVLEASNAVMGRAVGQVVADHVRGAHERHGTTVMTSVLPSRIVVSDGRAAGVELSDGRTVDADLVVISVGAMPRIELALRAGLLVDDGILVDHRMRASDGLTLAVGDCTRAPHHALRSPTARMRLESVDSALAQAEVAAATILGSDPPAPRVPWFWSDQGDLKLQVVGLMHEADSFVVRRYDDSRRLTVLHYRLGQLVAAESVNAPADAMAVRRALEQGANLSPARVGDPGLSLKALLTESRDDAISA